MMRVGLFCVVVCVALLALRYSALKALPPNVLPEVLDDKDPIAEIGFRILGIFAFTGGVVSVLQIMRIIGLCWMRISARVLGKTTDFDKEDLSFIGAVTILSCIVTFLLLKKLLFQPWYYALPPALFILISIPLIGCKLGLFELNQSQNKTDICQNKSINR